MQSGVSMAAAQYVAVARIAEVQMLRNRQKVANMELHGDVLYTSGVLYWYLIFASYPIGMTIRPNMYWTVYCFQTMLPAKAHACSRRR